MNLDIPDHLISDLLNVLGDMPAKRSYNLLQLIGPQVEAHNRRIQAAVAAAANPPQARVEPGVEPA